MSTRRIQPSHPVVAKSSPDEKPLSELSLDYKEQLLCRLEQQHTQHLRFLEHAAAAKQDLEITAEVSRELLAQIPVPVALIDSKGTVRDLNHKAAALLGSKGESCHNVPMAVFVCPDDLPKFLGHLRELHRCAKGETATVSFRLQTARGLRPVRCLTTKLMLRHEIVFEMAWLDSVEQNQLTAENAQLRAEFHDLCSKHPRPLLILTEAFEVVCASDVFCARFKIPKEKLLCQAPVSIAAWIPRAFQRRLRGVLQHDAALADFPVELVFPELGKKLVWIQARRFAGASGRPKFWIELEESNTLPRSDVVLRESEDRFRFALEVARMFVWDWDFATNRITWYPDVHELFGVDPAESGDGYAAFLNLVAPEDRGKVETFVAKAFLTGSPSDLEYRLVVGNGEKRWYHSRSKMFVNSSGSLARVVVVHFDVTDRKKTEEILQDKAWSLEANLESRNTVMAERTQVFDQFCAALAHDLRGPLRAMGGFAAALIEDYGRQLEDRGREFAQRIVHAADRLDQFILDLLEFSTLHRIQFTSETIPLEKPIRAAVGRLQNEIKAKNATVNIKRPLHRAKASAEIIQKAIEHLLTNALKFVPANKRPIIQIGTDRQKNYVRLWIKDNGIGVAEQFQERIFRLFERLHGDDVYPGTGIGLAFVSMAAQRMGGDAGVISKPDRGSKFWISLPAAE